MHAKQRLRRLTAALCDYGVAWTFGSIIGILFLLLVITGRIRVRGYWRYVSSVYRGNTIIAANHPSLAETLIMPAMGWPWNLFMRRFFTWSAPDHALFPSWLKWAYPVAHCIVVDRNEKDKKKNRAAITEIRTALSERKTILVHVEGGRSWKFRQRGAKLLAREGRRLAEIRSAAPRVAPLTGASILPLYIEMSRRRQRLTFKRSLLALFVGNYGRVVFHFGLPYTIHKPVDSDRENRKLQFMILTS